MSDLRTRLNDVQDAFDATLDEVYNTAPEILEITKIRIGLWDKVAILNAGTLALSLSAFASFRGHTIGDGGVGYLFAAWKLMILAIVCSLGAQWAATVSTTYIRRQLIALKTHRKLKRIEERLILEGVTLTEPHRSLLDEADREASKGNRYARPFERAAHLAGAAGLLATILGFYWLFRFAHTNIYHS